MSSMLSGIQSIISYYQDAEPNIGSASPGEIWYSPLLREAKIFSDGSWKPIEITPLTPGHLYGVICGGWSTATTETAICDKIVFPFDSGTASSTGDISVAKFHGAACSSSQYGYFMGGAPADNSAPVSSIERFEWPFDSAAIETGDLTTARHGAIGCDSSTHGYCMSGTTAVANVGGSVISSTERMLFPFSGDQIVVKGDLATARSYASGFNSSHWGYCVGGCDRASGTVDTTDRIEFPFDGGNAFAVGDIGPSAPTGGAGCNSSNAGYVFFGSSKELDPDTAGVLTLLSDVAQIDFSSDFGQKALIANINITRYVFASFNSTRYGYIAGGSNETAAYYPVGAHLDDVERVEFPFTAGLAQDVGSLSASRAACVGNEGTLFWF